MPHKIIDGMYVKSEVLGRHKEKFEVLSDEEKLAIIKVQKTYKRFWWNPDCKTVCLGHNKIHKYSFEAYVEGFVSGYFGFDTVEEMMSNLRGK